ncbi:MAG: hypothetical protein KC502_19410 [Myxococcales bacterium]|nr:hypothetical protein [Myxococcales bacterium]
MLKIQRPSSCRVAWLAVVTSLWLLAGCSSESGGTNAALDTGTATAGDVGTDSRADAGGASDATTGDAELSDAGSEDAASTDAAAQDDAGSAETGDAAAEDAGTGDAISADVQSSNKACTFNADCPANERCECSVSAGCFCKVGARGTGKTGKDTCKSGNDCETALCVEGPGSVYYCSGPCKTTADCGGKLPICSSIAFVGQICIRDPKEK